MRVLLGGLATRPGVDGVQNGAFQARRHLCRSTAKPAIPIWAHLAECQGAVRQAKKTASLLFGLWTIGTGTQMNADCRRFLFFYLRLSAKICVQHPFSVRQEPPERSMPALSKVQFYG